MSEHIELELATMQQIFHELGKRTACGNFIIWVHEHASGLLVGEQMKPKEIQMVGMALLQIAAQDMAEGKGN